MEQIKSCNSKVPISVENDVTTHSQPFPSTGTLAQNRNSNLSLLKNLYHNNDATVYYYVIATVVNEDQNFIQTGCGPNFQGGYISLCTCKHYIRTFLTLDQWIGKWIAGFSGLNAGNGRNALVYLMRIEYAYPSHASIWFSKDLPRRTIRAKAATNNKFGDIFEPISEYSHEYDPDYYKTPTDHVHQRGIIGITILITKVGMVEDLLSCLATHNIVIFGISRLFIFRAVLALVKERHK